jgi:hypothetical protein
MDLFDKINFTNSKRLLAIIVKLNTSVEENSRENQRKFQYNPNNCNCDKNITALGCNDLKLNPASYLDQEIFFVVEFRPREADPKAINKERMKKPHYQLIIH